MQALGGCLAYITGEGNSNSLRQKNAFVEGCVLDLCMTDAQRIRAYVREYNTLPFLRKVVISHLSITSINIVVYLSEWRRRTSRS